MILKVYSVYDSKIGAYARPFFMNAKGAALRAWENTVNDPESEICRHPGDFTLFELGEFDEETGKVTNHHTAVNMGLALEFKKKPAEQLSLAPQVTKIS